MIANNCMEKSEKIDEKEIIAKKFHIICFKIVLF